ncbi:hypothetical protein Q5Y75_11600 [Ruegeria sp. 2205SS24-7]|nr:hypothetical protein [Ruegeria sp. 2205SS24-7]MDP5217864.1 hypothetical protein [Ruegeria sp. 2205SS24-7]
MIWADVLESRDQAESLSIAKAKNEARRKHNQLAQSD